MVSVAGRVGNAVRANGEKKGTMHMNWNQIKGSWQQMKGKVRTEWGKLTDDDVERAKGDFQQLRGAVQKRYGLEKEEAERQLNDWAARQAEGDKTQPRR